MATNTYNMKYQSTIIFCFFVLAVWTSCRKENHVAPGKQDPGAPTQSLRQAVTANPEMTIFAAALQRTKLDDSLLAGKGPYTVYGPSDNAFQQAGVSLATIQSMSLDSLRALVRYHIAPGYSPSYNSILYKEFRQFSVDSTPIYTEKGMKLTTTLGLTAVYPDNFYVNGFLADSIDKDCTNGLLFQLGGLLSPPIKQDALTYLSTAPQLRLWYYAMKVVGQDKSMLNPKLRTPGVIFTVFPLTNDAMHTVPYLRDSATIDSAYAKDRSNGTSLVSGQVTFYVYSQGALFGSDLLISTYGNDLGYGLLPSDMKNVAFGLTANFAVQADALQQASFGLGYKSNTTGAISVNPVFTTLPSARLVSNGVIYPINTVIN